MIDSLQTDRFQNGVVVIINTCCSTDGQFQLTFTASFVRQRLWNIHLPRHEQVSLLLLTDFSEKAPKFRVCLDQEILLRNSNVHLRHHKISSMNPKELTSSQPNFTIRFNIILPSKARLHLPEVFHSKCYVHFLFPKGTYSAYLNPLPIYHLNRIRSRAKTEKPLPNTEK
jgi:hypothetical protein